MRTHVGYETSFLIIKMLILAISKMHKLLGKCFSPETCVGLNGLV